MSSSMALSDGIAKLDMAASKIRVMGGARQFVTKCRPVVVPKRGRDGLPFAVWSEEVTIC